VPQLSALVLTGIVIVYDKTCNHQNPEFNTVFSICYCGAKTVS